MKKPEKTIFFARAVMSTKPPAPAVTCGRTPSLETLTRAVAVDLQEGQQRRVEAAALEIGELVRRGHDRLGVGGAAELEVEQRHAADRALLDHPGHVAVPALLDQDARHVGRDAEADVDRIAVAQLLRDAPRDDLLRRSNSACWKDDSGRKISPEIAGS